MMPGQPPPPPPGELPPTRRTAEVRAAGAAWFLVAATFAAWSIVGWQHMPRFAAAIERVFNIPAFADDDYVVALTEYSFAGTMVICSALAFLAALVGLGLVRAWRTIRVWTAGIGLLVVVFTVKVLLPNFPAHIEAPRTGVSDQVWQPAESSLDQLTSWRLAGWYHSLSIATGMVAVITVAGTWYLLFADRARKRPA